MALFPVQIISPEGTIWSGTVKAVLAVGIDGSFGVMANHRPMIAALVPGAFKMQEESGGALHYAVGEGILEVRDDKRVVLLVDYAEPCESAEEAKVKAKELQHML
ncbi:ATP synthase F1 subunit epsilon [Pontiella agarivorans]|uniref:ATP synthase epsilon chain n=1 Tax=Pontiella agarivorans TaxID=3038953 RepID=A0ABU5MWR6_9BACT|nr:ATP synthase F1 subunit epsilon [Pontiella agarivorans]MDZ8118640.1 ATP synthase F1 subunit epsilon [Pontiella agarivorans]